mgnify:CR=1 FL=1
MEEIQHYLEIPNKHLGGYPACPFAKMAWLQDKVQIEIKPKFLSYKKELNDYIYTLDFAVKEILIFCDPFYSYTPNQFHQITEEYNNKYNKIDMYFMSFHPHNPATTEEHDFLVENLNRRILKETYHDGKKENGYEKRR